MKLRSVFPDPTSVLSAIADDPGRATESEPSASLSIGAKLFRLVLSLWVVTLVGVTTGNAKTYRAYEGPRRPAHEVALVFATNYISAITEIDGEEVALKFGFWAGPPEVELLPGDHTITVAFFKSGVKSSLAFAAEAGQRYELTRWGNNAVLLERTKRRNKPLLAPVPGLNDVIVRSPLVSRAGSDGERIVFNNATDGLRLLSIDGESCLSPVYGFAVRLPPGSHTFTLNFKDQGGFFQSSVNSAEPQTIEGDLKAGRAYVVDLRLDQKKKTWSPILVEDTSRSASPDSELVP